MQRPRRPRSRVGHHHQHRLYWGLRGLLARLRALLLLHPPSRPPLPSPLARRRLLRRRGRPAHPLWRKVTSREPSGRRRTRTRQRAEQQQSQRQRRTGRSSSRSRSSSSSRQLAPSPLLPSPSPRSPAPTRALPRQHVQLPQLLERRRRQARQWRRCRRRRRRRYVARCSPSAMDSSSSSSNSLSLDRVSSHMVRVLALPPHARCVTSPRLASPRDPISLSALAALSYPLPRRCFTVFVPRAPPFVFSPLSRFRHACRRGTRGKHVNEKRKWREGRGL